jgi:hypothetical protein
MLPPSSGTKRKGSKKPEKAGSMLSLLHASAGFMLELRFDPEDGADMFL